MKICKGGDKPMEQRLQRLQQSPILHQPMHSVNNNQIGQQKNYTNSKNYFY